VPLELVFRGAAWTQQPQAKHHFLDYRFRGGCARLLACLSDNALTHARKVAAIERQLMKLKIGTRRRLLRLAYYMGGAK